MSSNEVVKPLKSILVFGASGHVAEALADHLIKESPNTKLRLATSNVAKKDSLQTRFPTAEICICSYYDMPAMTAAFEGVEAAYMITPDFTDEELACSNFISAAKATGTIRQIVRLMGDPPGMTLDRVPEYLREFGGGASAAVGHTIARKLFNDSGLPVTYTSVAAYFMDDLSGVWYGPGIVNGDVLAEVKCHHMPYVDAPEIGEAAARIFLRQDPNDIGRDFLLNNGIDCWDFHDVAKILSKELGRQISYEEGETPYRKWMTDALETKVRPGATDFIVAYFTWEDSATADIVQDLLGGLKGSIAGWVLRHGPRWLRESLARNLWNNKAEGIYHSDLEDILGRTPKSLNQWVRENKSSLTRN